MSEHFFVRVPEALYDARRQNEITATQFDIMALLHRWVDWHTGTVRHCSAERLQRAMGELEKPPSIRTIQRHEQGLHEAGWVISHYRKGSKKTYPVDICNFMPVAEGGVEVAVIRPTETSSWEDTNASRVVDEGADGDGDGIESSPNTLVNRHAAQIEMCPERRQMFLLMPNPEPTQDFIESAGFRLGFTLF